MGGLSNKVMGEKKEDKMGNLMCSLRNSSLLVGSLPLRAPTNLLLLAKYTNITNLLLLFLNDFALIIVVVSSLFCSVFNRRTGFILLII